MKPQDRDADARVEAIFDAALKLTSATERGVYLDEACREDEALRCRVEALLETYPDSDAGWETRGPELPLENPGDAIGNYVLVKRLGVGGFGEVYLAEQERPLRRQVALKVLKAGMDTREVMGRFEGERQALALMDHPGIAKVYDAGVTPRGRPYFVMELARGQAITRHCDHRRASIYERLALLAEVCRAVHHAHQKGIIHRDLKPSNIIVSHQDGRPVIKVIDFGIAKATGETLTEEAVVTLAHQFMGTPAYMSPEQARGGGRDIDTRTDVYSLGVLLFELLTGSTPFQPEQMDGAGMEEIRRRILDPAPGKPSARVGSLQKEEQTTVALLRRSEVGKLIAHLRGDLDWISLKALERDRNRRYDSAAALADDIERHLRHEPVSAVAPSTLYRVVKFARRNRAAVAAILAFYRSSAARR